MTASARQIDVRVAIALLAVVVRLLLPALHEHGAHRTARVAPRDALAHAATEGRASGAAQLSLGDADHECAACHVLLTAPGSPAPEPQCALLPLAPRGHAATRLAKARPAPRRVEGLARAPPRTPVARS